MTEHPLFAYDNVVVTPHLGASTTEAQDRAGVITAEQVVAALRAAWSRTRSTSRRSAARTSRRSSPTCRSRRSSGGSRCRLPTRTVGRPIEASYYGHLADFDTRLLTLSVLNGALAGRIEENVNLVNAAAIAEERGIARDRAQGAASRATTRTSLSVAVVDGRPARRGRRHDLRPAARAPPRLAPTARASTSS